MNTTTARIDPLFLELAGEHLLFELEVYDQWLDFCEKNKHDHRSLPADCPPERVAAFRKWLVEALEQKWVAWIEKGRVPASEYDPRHHFAFERGKLEQANQLLLDAIGITNRPGNTCEEKSLSKEQLLAMAAAREELYRQARAGLGPRQKVAAQRKPGAKGSRELMIEAAVSYLLAEREVVEHPIDGKGIHAENFTNNVLEEITWSDLAPEEKVPSKRTARRILNDPKTRFAIWVRYQEVIKNSE